MKIAVAGCAHGQIEAIYDTIKNWEEQQNVKIDLLLCCGDFQSIRNEADLSCVAAPQKYADIGTFYKYYSGEKKAPVLTIFIGGHQEASNYLQELPYGGWVAPNIYYIGYAGVINVAGIRIGGISGIFKITDFAKGRYERSPYNFATIKSVYHVRNLEIYRLLLLDQKLDIFLSHDWPSGIIEYGNKDRFFTIKSYFIEHFESGYLGSKASVKLLHTLKPNYWFAAHLHCKFTAVVPHGNGTITNFLALDKCEPYRSFLEIVDIPHDQTKEIKIDYDLEWLTILYSTNHLINITCSVTNLPEFNVATDNVHTLYKSHKCQQLLKQEKSHILNKFSGILTIPENFTQTVYPYNPNYPKQKKVQQPVAQLNPQTTDFCTKLGLDDPMNVLIKSVKINFRSISIDESNGSNETDDNIDEVDCLPQKICQRRNAVD